MKPIATKMPAISFTCPRCRYAGVRQADVRFCPRCGLADVTGEEDSQPIALKLGTQTIVVRDRLALGDISNLYRCQIEGDRQLGVLKIARTHVSNQYILREAQTLKRLHDADREERFGAFLPRSMGTLPYEQQGDEPARTAGVLSYHPGISGPDELYTLEEVRDAYPNGIDPRDMAWIWRRVLSILGFVHQTCIVHGSVTPDHVLIEPKDHKLVLIGWCGAVRLGVAPALLPQRWRGWSNWDHGAAPVTDLASAAKSMMYLLNDKPEPAVQRHLERATETSSGAWKLLDDFDRAIEALWGPRQFRTFVMPARRV